jgi:hypothetical protein
MSVLIWSANEASLLEFIAVGEFWDTVLSCKTSSGPHLDGNVKGNGKEGEVVDPYLS